MIVTEIFTWFCGRHSEHSDVLVINALRQISQLYLVDSKFILDDYEYDYEFIYFFYLIHRHTKTTFAFSKDIFIKNFRHYLVLICILINWAS